MDADWTMEFISDYIETLSDCEKERIKKQNKIKDYANAIKKELYNILKTSNLTSVIEIVDVDIITNIIIITMTNYYYDYVCDCDCD